ncbi:Predicted RNA binding protein YcfA, dsRBD-like fold, HicA-like mRNA interferase family [Proteiniborus ethanoligenes]|uniref:Predicted RNA binding protein YcfA, dsRBD-like fold, HicA-like mRNA interferase family n=1 Tax=Proteiniborus ethanoligenes TaxID=415015 RepID=A0A1H3KND6_9FIRM|nr:type II toxin-antitoxin system HicA family toxin [Proteiniborus ethanoligenes]SDY53560.1 Predicted RNA binding protein YcfA, dsRBD-like fold, HicA-like mRNA interferase family [Proteiniborus ethanoligenes]
MGSKYPVLSPNEIIKALEKIGFQKISQKGSHAKYKKFGNPSRVIIIPMHDEVAKGTLKSILEQADLPLEEFLNLL